MHEEAVRHLSATDKTLGRVIRQVGPCLLTAEHNPRQPRGPFESLVEAVAHQQLTGKAAQTILGRMKALHPRRKFPTPEDLLNTSDEQLRGVGFSRAKVAAIKDISAKTLDGVVPTARAIVKLTDEEIIERLTSIRGVGRWTVEMLLMFQLGRPDVLPVDDFGVRKGFAVTYGLDDLPKPARLLEHGERWRPFRSVAAWYMWRALERHRLAAK